MTSRRSEDSPDAGEYKVVGAVVMSPDASGNVNVTDQGGGEVAGGAGLGAAIGRLVKRHEEGRRVAFVNRPFWTMPIPMPPPAIAPAPGEVSAPNEG